MPRETPISVFSRSPYGRSRLPKVAVIPAPLFRANEPRRACLTDTRDKLTAWVGLNLAEVKAGETIFISGAAGAVGSAAGQLAKQRGCRVIGSAGSPEKTRFLLDECRFDVAAKHKETVVEGIENAADAFRGLFKGTNIGKMVVKLGK